jgi:glycogen debranching enzyme GlgX
MWPEVSAWPAGGTPRMTAGRPWPLGTHWDGSGVNVAVCSTHATAIECCLFDPTGQFELARLALPGHTDDVWHGRIEGAGPGLVYGLRAHGPWRPDRGHWFNPHKLLLDPWARDIVGRFEWRDEHFAADRQHPQHPNPRDNAATALKARVMDARPGRFDWGDDQPPATPLADTVFYELHVKAWSQLNPELPEALRGSYAGLAHPASIAHLLRLGVTAVELLPVHYHLDEERLVQMGLVNHWGYNTLGFFCPDPRYASGAGGLSPADEFRQMVKDLHAAGLEVILDVVYNHTAESDANGPAISWRGLDNASSYAHHHDAQQRAQLDNHTGCGNTLDIRQPRVLQLVMDSLRWWAEEMHVDGFRFDLAPVLGRGDQGFDPKAPFFAALAQDPVLARVKLIAEPWDIGPGGYQVGNFPRGWLEWNDHFRDTMRGWWLHMGHGGGPTRADFAQRLCASSDLFQRRGRLPSASVNFVVSHDGYTLRDLVSHNERHNHANGEQNRDGHGHNLSHNCGVEGPTDDPRVNALRARLQRALLATTLLSQGTPLLAAGDELGHTQGGNNNPYCQDNKTTWIDWSLADQTLVDFTAHVLALRRALRPFDQHWYTGLPDRRGLPDLAWLRSDGQSLEGEAWRDPQARVLGCLIGRPARAHAPLLLLVNADPWDRLFRLPAGVWQVVLDSTEPDGSSHWHGQGEVDLPLPAHAVLLLAAAGALPATP